MLDCFKVNASSGEYSVHIGHSPLNSSSGDFEGLIIICDKLFAPDYETIGLKVISIDGSETSKSLDRMSEVIMALRNLGANRTTTLLAIGGGVIQDIVTFIASIYMRGLKWNYMPTTLLGMVDSCVGGKSSINVGNFKNLIGNFYPPQNIFIDLQFLDTLNIEQKIAGLCEAAKICFSYSGTAFEKYIKLNPGTHSSPAIFQELIGLSLHTKRWFVEIDEHDQKERQLLNFGHTFGHAIEGASGFSIPHGIAVGMGMLVAIEVACLMGLFTSSFPVKVKILGENINLLLSSVVNLPLWSSQIDVDGLMTCFNIDKKHTSTHYFVILPDATGQLVRLELEKNRTNCILILDAFRKICQSVGKSA